MSPVAARPRRPEIEYPDSDGQPMAENTLQFEWIVTIKAERLIEQLKAAGIEPEL